MKRPEFSALLVVMMIVTCVITLTTSAPATSSPLSNTNKQAVTSSPDSKSQDDTKKKAISSKNGKTVGSSEDTTTVRKKKSEEFIQFGNQQNKPAGMVDDALSGIATKKNTDMKRQQSYDEVIGPRVDEDESGAENDPLSSLMMDGDRSKGELIPSDDNPFGNDREIESESYRGVLPMESQLQDDTQSAFRGLREQANRDRFNAEEWFGGVDEYGNRRRRRNIARNERNFRKRSLHTTAEQLMNMRGSSRRWKRDVRVREDDVLGFLSLLAAAELAKEQEDRQRESERLQEIGFPWAPMLDLEEDPAIEPSLYRYYYRPDQSVNPEILNQALKAKETPDVFMMNSDEMSPMKRGFYPAVDYRSLGIIGAKKRRRQHPQFSLSDLEDLDDEVHPAGSWGKIRETNRRNEPKLRQILGDYNSQEDDSDNQESSESGENIENYGNHRSDSEKLYSLGELLNGNSEVEDYRYPVYRRLI